ncbi:hypothetical protein ACMD2_06259 [Ananas comosus]|uniref:XS domain-containing protein n=1 Tax=Ananas comosus TaxID=4615 RepID=A0A199VZ81_ANACO|nr:hypothetical protein ACMD2_06259 [Ananas comosus]
MKNPKASSSGKGSSQKAPSSLGSGGAGGGPSAASGNRKSRWEPNDKPPSDRRPSGSDSKPLKPKDEPSGPSSAAAAAAAAAATPNPKEKPAAPTPVSGNLRSPHSAGPPFHLPDPAAVPPPPPPYGFHNLERRTIVLADGSVRSYFALPPDPPPAAAAAAAAADKMFPYRPPIARPGFGHGPEPGVGLGFDRHYPPPPGGRFSPEDHLRDPRFGRGSGPQNDYWASLGLDGPRGPSESGPSSLKRKYGEDDELAWSRRHVLLYGGAGGNPPGLPPGVGGERDDLRSSKHAKLGAGGYEGLPSRSARVDDAPAVPLDVDKQALKRAFLKFSKTINESFSQKKNYLENGKNEPLKCIACGRASKDFADVHALIMHAYHSQNADMRVDHLGLHKALCVLMGWNYAKAPENSKAYQLLSPDDSQANREDLILWPPIVIIHNTNLGRRKDGRMEGMGNKEMDNKLKDLGFPGGKSKSLYGKEGHLGVTLVKFANTEAGLKEAERLAEYFEKEGHGRRGWSRAQATLPSGDDDKNPLLVKLNERTGEKKRILYGYLATASDLDKVDFDMKKRASVKSKREFDLSD